MKQRRGRGEGGVYRRADGQWCASLTTGYDDVGRRRRRVVYGPTKGDVLEKLAKLQGDSALGLLVAPQRITVKEFLDRWLADVAKPAVRPRTYQIYEWAVRKHIVRRIGGTPLQKLTPIHIQGWFTSMAADGVSARTQQIVFTPLRRALKQAMRWGLLRHNPCDGVERPRAPRPQFTALDVKQVAALLKAAKSDRLYALYVLAVTTGLRQGELLGLQWTDIDLKAARLSVNHILEEATTKGSPRLAEPKTATSRRRVDLPKLAVAALRQHRRRMLADGHVGGYVFCDTDGGPIRKNNLTRRSFKPLLVAAKLPDIRFHDLRHTAATLLLAQEVHPKVVQERLGHAQINITLDTYSHVLPSMQKEATARLDRVLAKAVR